MKIKRLFCLPLLSGSDWSRIQNRSRFPSSCASDWTSRRISAQSAHQVCCWPYSDSIAWCCDSKLESFPQHRQFPHLLLSSHLTRGPSTWASCFFWAPMQGFLRSSSRACCLRARSCAALCLSTRLLPSLNLLCLRCVCDSDAELSRKCWRQEPWRQFVNEPLPDPILTMSNSREFDCPLTFSKRRAYGHPSACSPPEPQPLSWHSP